MKRRKFITLLCGVSAAWPLAVRAQQSNAPIIGVLIPASSPGGGAFKSSMASFRKGLETLGFEDGVNVKIEYGWAENNFDRMSALLADFIARKVSVIAAVGGAPSLVAAKAATATIPIVFANGTDPVKLGIVESLNRPSGNVTGATFLAANMAPKRLELIRSLIPSASTVAVLINPKNQNTEFDTKSLQQAASTLNIHIQVMHATNADEIASAFSVLSQRPPDALLINADSIFSNQRDQLVAHTADAAIPTIFYLPDFVRSGGLVSYGGSAIEAYRQAGIYTGRVLKGAKPTDLPIMLPTKFEFVINLKTAKALGLEIPPQLLALADEVIE
jgi:putative ABC transport system substrate-binding protein